MADADEVLAEARALEKQTTASATDAVQEHDENDDGSGGEWGRGGATVGKGLR